MNAPFDPFQGARPAAVDPYHALAARWAQTVMELDDDSYSLGGGAGGADDQRRTRLWSERVAIEDEVMAIRFSTLAGAVLKLRIASWYMATKVDEDSDPEQQIVASALADVDNLAGGVL